jgi:hypothetical protein
MKTLFNVLERSNLSPKERVILQVKHKLALERTGTGIFSEAEYTSIGSSWNPKNEYEGKVYNKYSDAVNTHLDIRNQFVLRSTQLLLKLSELSRVLEYFTLTKNHDKFFEFETVDLDSPIYFDFLLENMGVSYKMLLLEHPEYEGEIQKLIDENKLEIYEHDFEIADKIHHFTDITAKSIYTLPDVHFLKVELLKQLPYFRHFAYLYLLFQKAKIIEEFNKILSVKIIYRKLNNIFDCEIGYIVNQIEVDIQKEVDLLNTEFKYYYGKMEDDIFFTHKPSVYFHINTEKLEFSLKDLSEVKYCEKENIRLEELLGREYIDF